MEIKWACPVGSWETESPTTERMTERGQCYSLDPAEGQSPPHWGHPQVTALTDSQAAGHLTKLATLDYGENQPNRFHTLSLTLFSQSPTISIPLSLTLMSLSLISSLFKVTHFPGFSVLFLSSPALFSSAGVSYCTMIPCISGYSPLCWVDIFSAWGPPIIHVLSTREVEHWSYNIC